MISVWTFFNTVKKSALCSQKVGLMKKSTLLKRHSDAASMKLVAAKWPHETCEVEESWPFAYVKTQRLMGTFIHNVSIFIPLNLNSNSDLFKTIVLMVYFKLCTLLLSIYTFNIVFWLLVTQSTVIKDLEVQWSITRHEVSLRGIHYSALILNWSE